MICPHCNKEQSVETEICDNCGCNLITGEYSVERLAMKSKSIHGFKSVHIDFDERIFLLNGKPTSNIEKLSIQAENGYWRLDVTYYPPASNEN